MTPRKIIRCLLDYRTCGSRGFFYESDSILHFLFFYLIYSVIIKMIMQNGISKIIIWWKYETNTHIQTHLNLDNNTPLFCGSRAKTVGDPTRVDSAAVRTCHRMLMWTKEVQTKKRHESLALTRTGQFYCKKLQKPV